MSEGTPPFLRRVVLRNYKSIRECDVSLGPLTFLVGPNGSGKSNFLDALRFVAESLRTTLEQAITERRGFDELCHRPSAGEKSFAMDLHSTLPGGRCAYFRFVVARRPSNRFQIQEEVCTVTNDGAREAQYRVQDGRVVSATFRPTPPATRDRLYLAVASGFPEFRSVYDSLAAMRFYNISPEVIRAEANISTAERFMRDGQGAIIALRELAIRSPAAKERIVEYMRAILPCLEQVEIESFAEWMQRHKLGSDEQNPQLRNSLWLWFPLATGGKTVRYSHWSMSDGTLRALGVLLALFQCVDRPEHDPIPLVGIEEPEATLHPAAAGVLFDALHEASHFTQVLVTTHSAELLDIKDLDPDSLLVVDLANGETIIGPADEASLSAMKDRMYTAGELLEMNQLRANPRPAQEAGAGSGGGSSALPPNSA
jgi:predicted ATPase